MKIKNKFIAKILKKISDEAPTILTGTAVGGVVASLITMRNSTLKADKIIKEHQAKQKEELKFKEKFLLTWKMYIPTAVSAGLTIAAIISSNVISKKRLSALSILCSGAEAALSQYQNKVEQLIGKNKAQKVKDEIAQDIVDASDITENDDEESIQEVGQGTTWCLDKLTGRKFKSSAEHIRRAQNDANMALLGGSQISLNEFYDYLGLDNCSLGDIVGFDESNPVNISFSSALKGSQPVLVLSYNVSPIWYDSSSFKCFGS